VEVDKDETETFKVISTALLNTKMSVNSGISSCTCQIFAVSVWNVLASLWIPESLCKTKVYHIDKMLLLLNSNQKVVRLDITVKEMARVDKFKSLKHLISEHQDCFEGELSLAIVKKIL